MPMEPQDSGSGVFSFTSPAPLRTATRSSLRLVARVVVLIVGGVKVFGKNWGRSVMLQDYLDSIDELFSVEILNYGVL